MQRGALHWGCSCSRALVHYPVFDCLHLQSRAYCRHSNTGWGEGGDLHTRHWGAVQCGLPPHTRHWEGSLVWITSSHQTLGGGGQSSVDSFLTRETDSPPGHPHHSCLAVALGMHRGGRRVFTGVDVFYHLWVEREENETSDLHLGLKRWLVKQFPEPLPTPLLLPPA